MRRLLAYGILGALALASSAVAETEHRVRNGETLSEIANAYGTTVTAIEAANDLRNADKIRVGQTLVIPANGPEFIEYKIRPGDTISELAKKHGVSVSQVTAYNNIRQANRIRVGQVIKIPLPSGASPSSIIPWRSLPDATLKALEGTRPSNQWKHIVIHHSGTRVGSAASFDRFHREERRMENGLAYHFLIGNGNGMGDGEIHIGNRWKRQIQGGHLSSYALNQTSIGICLVGDFEKARPSRRQMEQLEALIHYLMDHAGVPESRVTTHTLIHPKHTACPGRLFPTSSLKKAISR